MNRDAILREFRAEREKKHRRLWALTLLALLPSLFSPKPASAQTDVEAEIEKIQGIIKKYEKAVDDADTKLASEIWSQTGDVSFIHPRGHEHGWEEIKKNVYEKAMRDLFSERKLTTSKVLIHVYKDAAWAEFDWVFVAKFRSDGSPLRTEGRESQVYRKTDRGWVLVHVHYSGMPVRAKGEGF